VALGKINKLMNHKVIKILIPIGVILTILVFVFFSGNTKTEEPEYQGQTIHTGTLTVTSLASCDTIDTDGDGVFACGVDGGGSGGAPTDADYLIGTANGDLSAEIVVGTTPGGELGNTWASPTIDTTHSGSAHHSAVTVTDSTTINLTLATQDITADGLYTAGDALTLTGADFDFDGGAAPGGELGGADWANITVDATHSGSAHHAAVTITGEDFLSLSTQQITANAINSDNLSATDFGGFTCDGSVCPVDSDGTWTLHNSYPAACTNQFVRGLGDTNTCETVDISSDTNLTAGTNITLAADTLNVDDAFLLLAGDSSSNGYTWGGAHDFDGGSLEIPQDDTIDAVGEIGQDTTSDTLRIWDGSAERVFDWQNSFSFTIASTTFDIFKQIPIKAHKKAITITDIHCMVVTATDQDIFISDGTNDTETIACDTNGQEDGGSIANGTFSAREQMYVEIGTKEGTPDWLNVTINFTIDAD